MSPFSKTALYAARPSLPPLVEQAVAIANHLGFIHSCIPEEGAGRGKRENDPPADPAVLLKPGGTLVLDDFYPPMEFWPEAAAPRDEYGRSTTAARTHWLQHPALFATEVRVHPHMSVILATRKAARS